MFYSFCHLLDSRTGKERVLPVLPKVPPPFSLDPWQRAGYTRSALVHITQGMQLVRATRVHRDRGSLSVARDASSGTVIPTAASTSRLRVSEAHATAKQTTVKTIEPTPSWLTPVTVAQVTGLRALSQTHRDEPRHDQLPTLR